MPLRRRKAKSKPMQSNKQASKELEDDDRGKLSPKRICAMAAVIVLILLIVLVTIFAQRSSNAKQHQQASSVLIDSNQDSTINKSTVPSLAPTNRPNVDITTVPPTPRPYTRVGSFTLLETVPHDTQAFTQGLCIHNGKLFEGTGIHGQSELRIVELTTGKVLLSRSIGDEYFGEGIAYYDNRLIQLTWREQTGFIYNATSLERLETFTYSTQTNEGWGITVAEEDFLVSDGSNYMHRWNRTRHEISRFPVTMRYTHMEEAVPVRRLNELEWDTFSGTLLANVWMQDVILRIDIETGLCRTIYDLQSLFPNRPTGTDVLNGIALTEEPGVVWVTGKFWPNMYRIRLFDAAA